MKNNEEWRRIENRGNKGCRKTKEEGRKEKNEAWRAQKKENTKDVGRPKNKEKWVNENTEVQRIM